MLIIVSQVSRGATEKRKLTGNNWWGRMQQTQAANATREQAPIISILAFWPLPLGRIRTSVASKKTTQAAVCVACVVKHGNQPFGQLCVAHAPVLIGAAS